MVRRNPYNNPNFNQEQIEPEKEKVIIFDDGSLESLPLEYDCLNNQPLK